MSDLIWPVGNFIYQNYRQALEVLSLCTNDLKVLESKIKTTPSDYETFICEERKYLASLEKE